MRVYIKPHKVGKSRTYRVISESGRILRRGLPSWESAREWVRQQNAQLPRATAGVRKNPSKRGFRIEVQSGFDWIPWRYAAGKIYPSLAAARDEWYDSAPGRNDHARFVNVQTGAVTPKAYGGKVRKNPSGRAAVERAAVERADSLLESFTGSRGTKEYRVSEKPIRVGLAVGKLAGVLYEATRDGETAPYFHKFKRSSRPLLVADNDGSKLAIVGGRFRFTDRGIVDE